LKRGMPSVRMRWYFKYFKWVKIKPNSDFALTQYTFTDDNDDEIRLT
jgi:ribonuclease G